MILHKDRITFDDYIIATANYIGIPTVAVKRDYYIVSILEKLSKSNYAESCVFKGGTSLSKCYPNSINRFSEDIDLTYITDEKISDKEYSRRLKDIEEEMSEHEILEKIPEERNNRNKSSWIYFKGEPKDIRVKFEIGSSITPFPYEKREVKTYIQEFLESVSQYEEIEKYELKEIKINTLDIRRTFIDKVMAVKRHALNGNLVEKVRHIYDVTKLFELEEIRLFLSDQEKLVQVIKITKEMDSFYYLKIPDSKKYNSFDKYDFNKWETGFNDEVKKAYENLHNTLRYTDEKQDFDKAIYAFQNISDIFRKIGE